MAKRSYKRRTSGLYLTDDSIAVPKVGGGIPRPWWSSPYTPLASRAVGQVKFVDGKVFFVGGKVCFNPDCCCDVVCNVCENATAPRNWLVAIAGIADGDCSGCTDFNDDYTLSPGPCSMCSASECQWHYDDIGNNFCADDGNIFFINMQIQHWSLPPWGTAGYYLTVEFWYRDSPPSNVIYWGGWFYKQYTYPIDCSAIAGESLTKHHPPSPGYYSKCDMDSISCTVTAL